MAESILKIHTQNGDVPVGYPGLADKPIADKTLSKEGAFADSKAVGDKFKEVKAETDLLKGDLGDGLKFSGLIAASTLNIYLKDSDANNAPANTYFLFYQVNDTANIPTALDRSLYVLETYGKNDFIFQKISSNKGQVFVRNKIINTWTEWKETSGFDFLGVGNFDNGDLNNAPLNAYSITYNLEKAPQNSPDQSKNYCILTYGGENFVYQIYMSDNLYTRFNYGGIWSHWKSNIENKIFIVNKNGIESENVSTTLRGGVEKACKIQNAILYVFTGVYDLVEEFGNSFLENMNEESVQGLYLKNGVNVIFQPNSKVTFNYNGNNDFVKQNFSPFNTNDAEYGFTLNGCVIECSNCKYCVHDEHTTNLFPYYNRFLNCDFKIDNTQNNSWGIHQCIGGGLGYSGIIEIDNCSFDVVGASSNTLALSYHNCSLADAKSIIKVVNNRFRKNNGVGLTEYGSSKKVTRMIVTNNVFEGEPYLLELKGDTNNVKMIAYNNIGNVSFD